MPRRTLMSIREIQRIYGSRRHAGTVHPEQRTDEILYGNLSMDNIRSLDFKSKRVGSRCYDPEGKLLSISEKKYPLFVQISEWIQISATPDLIPVKDVDERLLTSELCFTGNINKGDTVILRKPRGTVRRQTDIYGVSWLPWMDHLDGKRCRVTRVNNVHSCMLKETKGQAVSPFWLERL
jgi:hypothetical protein